MAKRRRPTEDEVVRYAFFLACEGFTPPPNAPPRIFPPEIMSRRGIFKCLRHEFGRDAAKWAATMRLFTEH